MDDDLRQPCLPFRFRLLLDGPRGEHRGVERRDAGGNGAPGGEFGSSEKTAFQVREGAEATSARAGIVITEVSVVEDRNGTSGAIE